MRALCLVVLAATVLACAGEPAPKPEPVSSPAPSAGSVSHVNVETKMILIRTDARFAPGDLVRLEGNGDGVTLLRVGSWQGGMLAGLVESGTPVQGPCILTPVRPD